jgi:hypothetical protein
MYKRFFIFMIAGIAFLNAQEKNDPESQYFHVSYLSSDGSETLAAAVISGPPTPPEGIVRATVSSVDKASSSAKIIKTPAYEWSFGCAPTAAAMIAGYYDRKGYGNIYVGPTNSGIAPLDNSVWPRWKDSSGTSYAQCPLSATHKDLDGRSSRGHVDDYWVKYGDSGDDPYQSGGWRQHTYGTCTGDYMRTNQAVNYYDSDEYGNPDGATVFYYFSNGAPLTAAKMEEYGVDVQDGAYGFKRFLESRGYKVTTLYTQVIDTVDSDGFTFDQYKAEIDAGRPVFIHVRGHTMTGIGYDADTRKVYLHDTWDYDTHVMTWGDSYADMDQWGVTVVHLAPPPYKPSDAHFFVIPSDNNKTAVIAL